MDKYKIYNTDILHKRNPSQKGVNDKTTPFTKDHDQLFNRDKENSHPIEAITGLETALGNKADITLIPTKLSQLAGDPEHRTVTDAEKEKWGQGGSASGGVWTVAGAPENEVREAYNMDGAPLPKDGQSCMLLWVAGISNPKARIKFIDANGATSKEYPIVTSYSDKAPAFVAADYPLVRTSCVLGADALLMVDPPKGDPRKQEFYTRYLENFPEATDEASFHQWIVDNYNSPYRTWMISSSSPFFKALMARLGGAPDGATGRASIAMEFPYSRNSPVTLKARYFAHESAGVWDMTTYSSDGVAWFKTDWVKQAGGGGVAPEQLAEPIHTTMAVEISDDGFGGYDAYWNGEKATSDIINNWRNADGVVMASYDSPDGNTYTYWYSTRESDRRPAFTRTYIENGAVKQVIIRIDNKGKAVVEVRPARTMPGGGAEGDILRIVDGKPAWQSTINAATEAM